MFPIDFQNILYNLIGVSSLYNQNIDAYFDIPNKRQIDLLILLLIYVQMTEPDSLVLHSDTLVIILVIKLFTNYTTVYKD
jgi:hypothetical protein